MTGPPVLAWSSVSVFWLICLLIVLQQAWSGWRQGLIRQLAIVVGLLAGWIVGNTYLPNLLAHLWTGTGRPSSVSVFMASAILGIGVYVLAVLAGRLISRRSCDKGFGPTRIFFGLGGAGVGALLGIFAIWLLIVGVRVVGSIEQGGVDERDGEGVNPPMGASAPAFVRLQQSVESGLVGDIVRATDPLPTKTYQNLTRAMRILANPQLQARLIEAPGLQDFLQDPNLAELRQDPAVLRAWQRRDYWSLLHNQHLLAAANDPRLAKRWEKVDLSRVLNETVP